MSTAIKPLPPTLSEQYGEFSATEADVLQDLPDWAKTVTCDRCRGLMTPPRSKADKQWGETMHYQCQHRPGGVFCGLVKQLTTTVNHYMRPGDFSNSMFDWREVAPKVVLATTVKPKPTFAGVTRPVPSPWKREVASKVACDLFWADYKKGLTPADLLAKAIKTKGDTAAVRKLVDTAQEWITAHSGYAVTILDGVYQIVGRTVGNENLYPYSDASYRKAHGFGK